MTRSAPDWRSRALTNPYRVAGPYPLGLRSRDTERGLMVMNRLTRRQYQLRDLANYFGVTLGTIRSDLRTIRALGLHVHREGEAGPGIVPLYGIAPKTMLRFLVGVRPKTKSECKPVKPKLWSPLTGLNRA